MVPTIQLNRAPLMRMNQGWRPGALGKSKLGQEEEGRTVLDPWFFVNRQFLIWNGTAIGYTLLASLIYGKHRIVDRILLGLGAGFYGFAAYSGFVVATQRPSATYTYRKSDWDSIIGAVIGAVDAMAAAGALAAAINPKLISKNGMREAVASSIPG